MRKLVVFLCTMCAFLFVGCDKDGGGDISKSIVVASGVEVNQIVPADNTEGKSSVKFVTTEPWNSSVTDPSTGTTPDWITISPDKGVGAGEYNVKITLKKNEGSADRSAQIKVMCDGESVVVNVVQLKRAKQPEYALVKQIEYQSETGGVLLEKIVSSIKYDEQNRVSEFTSICSIGGDYTENVMFVYGGNTLTITTISGNKPEQWCDGVMTATLNDLKHITEIVDKDGIEHSAVYDKKGKGNLVETNFRVASNESHSVGYSRNIDGVNINQGYTTVMIDQKPTTLVDEGAVTYGSQTNLKTNLDFTWLISIDQLTNSKMMGMFGLFGVRSANLPIKCEFTEGDRGFYPPQYSYTEVNYAYEFDNEGRIMKVVSQAVGGSTVTFVLSY